MESQIFKDLNINPRTLLGPGPSMVHPRVMAAMGAPTVGHLDPQFQSVMTDVKVLLRYLFQTENEYAIPVSGTGSSGMEAAIANSIEPGDNVLIAVKGYFGERMAEMAGRYGGKVDRLSIPWGTAFTPDDIKMALEKNQYKVVGLVHCETSTGVLQDKIKEIGDIVHDHGAILILDTVASLGGVPVKVDEWGVDICYSGSQKCLSAPPGLAPITVGPKGLEVIRNRKTKVTSWYLDLTLLDSYWGTTRVYHHTAPVNLNYAMREALRLVYEEGLENTINRHRSVAENLWSGLEAMGFSLLIPIEYRSPTLTTPKIKPGVEESAVRAKLLSGYNIEIAGGFGPLAGQIWRIGLMGYSARQENATLLLAALGEIL